LCNFSTILKGRIGMKYTDKIYAAKFLYRRCSKNSVDGAETLLKVIENAVMAGMERHRMPYTKAVDHWLELVARRQSDAREGNLKKNFKKDTTERDLFLFE